MKWLMCYIFIANVTIPTVVNKRYMVESFEIIEQCYKLYLTTGETIYVPQMFTIIEKRNK